MRTGRNQSLVSVASASSSIRLAALLVAALGVGACAGRRGPATQAEPAGGAASTTSVTDPEARTETVQFDNQATVWVDVYLVGGQLQWRLGRVPPGFRATLRVPESAIPWTVGFVQLAVIPGSQASVEAWRDPRAIIAPAQPMSEVMSQRWAFRQAAGAALQLQATRLRQR